MMWGDVWREFFAKLVVCSFCCPHGSEVAIWFRYVLHSHHNHSRHELFEMINVLQDRARDSLKSIEADVDKTADLTEKAAEELELAQAHQGREDDSLVHCRV